MYGGRSCVTVDPLAGPVSTHVLSLNHRRMNDGRFGTSTLENFLQYI